MQIIIIGGGKVGLALATQLTREDHDIVLVDRDRQVLKNMGEGLDMMLLYGNGASVDVLREADVEHADLLIAVTAMDEFNIMCCLIARKLGCTNTIARVRTPEYADQIEFFKQELGLSMTINPEWIAAREIFRLIQIPAFLKRDSFSRGRAEIVELEVREGMSLEGVQLFNLQKKVNVRVLVCAIQRDNDVYIPDGNFRLELGDKIYVTAPSADLARLVRNIGIKHRKSKDVLIIGGSKVAEYVASMLTRYGTRVKLLERDEARSLRLAEELPKATIVNADGTHQAVLLAQNIGQMDTVITLTNMDEENLIVSMYANHLGVPQVITKINRTEYNEVFQSKGIDCVISPKLLCAQSIIRYVRSMQSSEGEAALSVHYLVDGRVEALEFEVTKATECIGVPLRDVSLKPNLLIACINRRGKIIIPGGNDHFEHGDTVVIVTAADRVILEVNDIFKKEQT